MKVLLTQVSYMWYNGVMAEFRLRNIDDEDWKDFKMSCLEDDKNPNDLLNEYVKDRAEKWRSTEAYVKAQRRRKISDARTR